jgi:polysaccharide export outer membrane protein
MIGSKAHALVMALVLALGLAACTGGGPPPAAGAGPGPAAATGAAPQQQISNAVYRLGSGDKVKVTVFRHPDLSGEFSLDGSGNVALPLVGEIEAGGLTSRELEQKIVARLSDGLIREPQVGVEILNYRPFYILGEVKTPGSYPYQNNMNVLNAVALAGGFSYRAKQDGFLLQRGGSNSQGVVVRGDAQLLPGDIVTVRERFF